MKLFKVHVEEVYFVLADDMDAAYTVGERYFNDAMRDISPILDVLEVEAVSDITPDWIGCPPYGKDPAGKKSVECYVATPDGEQR